MKRINLQLDGDFIINLGVSYHSWCKRGKSLRKCEGKGVCIIYTGILFKCGPDRIRPGSLRRRITDVASYLK
jgi:hypothetical protein